MYRAQPSVRIIFGTALPHINTLSSSRYVFRVFGPLTTDLIIAPQKIQIIILAANFDEVKAALIDWLATHTPEWAFVKIDNKGWYLGMFLGPAASSMELSKTLAKWEARFGDISRAMDSPFAAVHSYNIHAHPILTYKAQSVFIPPTFPQQRSSVRLVPPQPPALCLGL